MALKKQEFYEGAALHVLARTGLVEQVTYVPPFFVFNRTTRVMLKYSTKLRSPWAFSFTVEEQSLLREASNSLRTVIGLVCGDDGIAAFTQEDLTTLTGGQTRTAHVSCYRKHRGHYEINGPTGTLARKVAPADWLRILSE